LRQESRSYYNYNFCYFCLAVIPLAAVDRETELGAVAIVVVYLAEIPLGFTELLGTGKQSLALLPMLLFLPGCDSLEIHRAARDRDTKLGAVAIVVVPTWL
jgi:hypothetical protein